MMDAFSEKKGNYILVMKLTDPLICFIPKFGNVTWQPGLYFYCGSAHGNGGLKSRVIRHLDKNSKKFWHIDYIKMFLQIVEVWVQINTDNNECAFSRFLQEEKNAEIVLKGFGATDCENACKTHLWMLPLCENLYHIFSSIHKQFKDMNRFYIPIN